MCGHRTQCFSPPSPGATEASRTELLQFNKQSTGRAGRQPHRDMQDAYLCGHRAGVQPRRACATGWRRQHRGLQPGHCRLARSTVRPSRAPAHALAQEVGHGARVVVQSTEQGVVQQGAAMMTVQSGAHTSMVQPSTHVNASMHTHTVEQPFRASTHTARNVRCNALMHYNLVKQQQGV
jgi:hypothetical protein